MKKLLLTLIFLLSGITLFAQNYHEVSIVDLNSVSDSLLDNATSIVDLGTSYDGETVKVVGTVLFAPMVDWENDRRLTTSSASRGAYVMFIQDTASSLWGGIMVEQPDSNFATGFDILDTGDVVEVTGVVSEGFYGNTTTLTVLVDPLTEMNIVDSKGKMPEPISVSISDFFDGGNYIYEAEKYENMYVEFNNVTTVDRNPTGSTNFSFTDGSGNKIFMYDQSGYFSTRGHRLVGNTDYETPADGTFLEHIRGIIHTRGDGWYLVPLYPGDMKVGEVAPATIAILEDSAPKVDPNADAVIKTRIVDNDGSVVEAKLFYQVDGGAFSELAMTLDDTAYVATIPGVNSDSSMVSYFIYAKDNDGNESLSPNDTSSTKYYYWVLNSDPSIYHIQVTPYRGNSSRFENANVTLTGVLTVDSSDTFSGSVQFIQQPGLDKWAGLRMIKVPNNGQKRGDLVTVTGQVIEDFFLTTLDVESLTVVSSPGEVVEPLLLQTSQIATGRNDAAEEYESMLIKYENVTVVNDNADGPNSNFGELLIDDGSGPTRVELQDGNNNYHNNWSPELADSATLFEINLWNSFSSLTGVMNYSFNNFKLIPRTDADFADFTTDVKQTSSLPTEFELQQNYPNPFNPTTVIEFSLSTEAMTSLRIFNILGQEVAVLMNEVKNSGSYKVNFDASELTTGIYFYQLNSGSMNIVKKMMLVK